MKYFDIIASCIEPDYKLIAQPPPGRDTGDSIEREGLYMLAIEVLHRLGLCDNLEYNYTCNRYQGILGLANDTLFKPGFIRRFPSYSTWEGRPDRLSRDQAVTNIISMGLVAPDRLSLFFKAHLKYRGLLFLTNTRPNGVMPGDAGYKWKIPDLTLFGFWSLYLRAFQKYMFLLNLFDLSLVFNSLIKTSYYGKNPENSDDLSHIAALLQSELVHPTFLSKLAMKIYSRRPYPSLLPGQVASNPAHACMISYFSGVSPGPKLDEVYREVLEHYFS